SHQSVAGRGTRPFRTYAVADRAAQRNRRCGVVRAGGRTSPRAGALVGVARLAGAFGRIPATSAREIALAARAGRAAGGVRAGAPEGRRQAGCAAGVDRLYDATARSRGTRVRCRAGGSDRRIATLSAGRSALV